MDDKIPFDICANSVEHLMFVDWTVQGFTFTVYRFPTPSPTIEYHNPEIVIFISL
jgi:hypothetical protein